MMLGKGKKLSDVLKSKRMLKFGNNEWTSITNHIENQMKETPDNSRTNYRDSYGFGVFGKSLLFLQIRLIPLRLEINYSYED